MRFLNHPKNFNSLRQRYLLRHEAMHLSHAGCRFNIFGVELKIKEPERHLTFGYLETNKYVRRVSGS